MKRGGKAATPADAPRMAGAGISDAAVRKATGRGWGDWYDVLDAAGAREMTHQQIMLAVAGHDVNEWWRQMVAVAYEQARGLRERHQREDGFAATASKSFKAGVTRVYAAWTEDEVRSAWLDSSGWHIRKSVLYKNLKITWKDGHTHLEIHMYPRGEGRTLVQVEHSKLSNLEDVQRWKMFWGVALERLREVLEAGDLAPGSSMSHLHAPSHSLVA